MVEEQGGRLMLGLPRTLTANDISSAMELSVAANWNQTTQDWLRLMHLSPDNCRCIEDAGQIVATTTLLPYSTYLGWIGMVLTRPEYRRQGLARRLMEDAISTAERDGIRTLKLDATDEGRPLYESLGFVVEKVVERWAIDGGPAVVAKDSVEAGNACSSPSELSEDLMTLDRAAFGVSRESLLKLLSKSGRCDAAPEGYVLSRSGITARYLGPCIARSETEASQLISTHLRCASEEEPHSRPGNWYWDLFPANLAAIRCAMGFGFTRRRTLWRMRRGHAIENNDAMVYAIAGFELG
jgi:GNAT superfamily N-acetyltransferase